MPGQPEDISCVPIQGLHPLKDVSSPLTKWDGPAFGVFPGRITAVPLTSPVMSDLSIYLFIYLLTPNVLLDFRIYSL